MPQLPEKSIDELVQEVRSHCCDKLQNLYSKITLITGKQINVDQLYVDVYLLENRSSESQPNSPDLLKDYNPQYDRIGLNQRGERSPGFEIAADYPRLMIVGKPGAGKTTFLRHLAVACCKGEFLADYIPILIELRDIKASEFNLFNSIYQEFGLLNEEQTKQILNQGKVLILLDGLDEVPSQSRLDVQDHIYNFPLQQQYYKNRFILTCRTQITEYISDKFQCVEVAEFKPEQVDEFAQNWFASFAETPEQAARLTVNFLNKLRLPENQPTAELAATPILLSLTCWIFTDLKDLPAKRSDLYERVINLLLKNWDKQKLPEPPRVRQTLKSKVYSNLSVTDKKTLLSYLAARKFEQDKYVLFEESEIQRYIAEYLDISTEESQEVLKAIEAHHGLLIERAQGIWSFSHLTFQEYFTAKWFCDKADWQGLANHITEKHWREVFLLAAEMPPTDRLLLRMKQQIDEHFAKYAYLQNVLNLAKEKSSKDYECIKPAVVRSLYLKLILQKNSPVEFIEIGNLVGNSNLVFGVELGLDLSLFKVLNAAQNLSSICEQYIAFTALAADTLDCSIQQAFIFSQFDIKFQQIVKELKEQLPKRDSEQAFNNWWKTNGKAWSDELRNVMKLHRNIGLDLQFREEQKELLQEYYYANKLLVDCLNSSFDVSADVKKKIEEELLLPLDDREKHQQQM